MPSRKKKKKKKKKKEKEKKEKKKKKKKKKKKRRRRIIIKRRRRRKKEAEGVFGIQHVIFFSLFYFHIITFEYSRYYVLEHQQCLFLYFKFCF